MNDELDKKITILNKRFAKKVDSLNWQSISYQEKAFATHNEAIKDIIATQVKQARLEEQNYHLDKLKTGKWKSYATEVTDRIKELEESK